MSTRNASQTPVGAGHRCRSGTGQAAAITLSIMPIIAHPQIADPGLIEGAIDRDPTLDILVPVLEQCLERQLQFRTLEDFLRTPYGGSCASILHSFGLVSSIELDHAWSGR
jgi:hypothetical protein